MFAGINGDHDQYTGAGRIAIAALMSGYGLNASTKKDLQARINWVQTPGCFLGQKELKHDSWGIRHRPALGFLIDLVETRKANRTLNYTLNWATLNKEGRRLHITSEIWPVVARVYWLGYFMFGRNVIPQEILAEAKTRFSISSQQGEQMSNLHNAYIMQFFYNEGFFVGQTIPSEWIEGFMPASQVEVENTRLPREKIFLSLALAMNFSENTTGFFAACAAIPMVLTPGQSFGGVNDAFEAYDMARSSLERGHQMPMTSRWGSSYNLTSASMHVIDAAPSRFPTSMREIVPLLLCDRSTTPQQEAANGYHPSFGQFQPDLLDRNLNTYIAGTLLYEYHLLLTGREITPLQTLRDARERAGFTEENIVIAAQSMHPMAQRNCTVWRLVKFHLDRQNQV
jgi:hypothetical protein